MGGRAGSGMSERSMYRILEDIEGALAELQRELRDIRSGLAALEKRFDQDRRENIGELAKLRSDIRVELRKQIRSQGVSR